MAWADLWEAVRQLRGIVPSTSRYGSICGHALAGRLREARKEAQAWAALSPDDAFVLHTLAERSAAVDRADEAVSAAQKAISVENAKARPDAAFLAGAYLTLGWAYDRQGREDEAQDAYEAIRGLTEDADLSRHGVARIDRRAEQFSLLHARGWALRSLGRTEEAYEILSRLHELFPHEPAAAGALAYVAYDLERYEQVTALLSRLPKWSCPPESFELLAAAYDRLGETVKATLAHAIAAERRAAVDAPDAEPKGSVE